MADLQRIQEKSGVFLFTTDTVQGFRINEYYGVVTGQAIFGANFVKDFFARVHDKWGGRVTGYEGALASAMEKAIEDAAASASRLGANAILALKVQTQVFGKGGLLMATCQGTAVEVVPVPR